MSEAEQDAQVGQAIRGRQATQRELACWQDKLTRWGRIWESLLSADERKAVLLLEDYPASEQVLAAMRRIATLRQEITCLDTFLHNCGIVPTA